jgi:hypothetical protein
MGIRECVRRVDNMMVFLERDEMVGPPMVPYMNEQDHPRLTIHDLVPDFYPWPADVAKQKFLEKYEEIVANDGDLIPDNYMDRDHLLQAA